MTSVDLDGRDRQAAAEGVGAGRAMTWFLIVTSALGFVASFTLTYERFKLFTEPGYKPSCASTRSSAAAT